jgi:hypothetical protein
VPEQLPVLLAAEFGERVRRSLCEQEGDGATRKLRTRRHPGGKLKVGHLPNAEFLAWFDARSLESPAPSGAPRVARAIPTWRADAERVGLGLGASPMRSARSRPQTPVIQAPPARGGAHYKGADMSTPYLYKSFVDARVDDLRRTMATSRARQPRADGRSDQGRRQPARTRVIRALGARLAH